jgi:hypothetical protein
LSDQSGGVGWWLASDGKWYPPPHPSLGIPSPDRPKGPWWRSGAALGGLLAAVVLVLGVVVMKAGASGDEESATRTTTTSTPTTSTTEPPSGLGTQADPFSLGSTAIVGDWDVTVLELREATAEIAAANRSNDPPPDGFVYVLVRLRGTFQGDGEGDFFTDLGVGYVDPDGQTYRDYDCLAVEPDSILHQPSVTAGKSVEGNLCLQVPADVFGTGTLFVDRSPSTDAADRRWWA